jgi:hypothetical protein
MYRAVNELDTILGPVQAAAEDPFVGCCNVGNGDNSLAGTPPLGEIALKSRSSSANTVSHGVSGLLLNTICISLLPSGRSFYSDCFYVPFECMFKQVSPYQYPVSLHSILG